MKRALYAMLAAAGVVIGMISYGLSRGYSDVSFLLVMGLAAVVAIGAVAPSAFSRRGDQAPWERRGAAKDLFPGLDKETPVERSRADDSSQ